MNRNNIFQTFCKVMKFVFYSNAWRKVDGVSCLAQQKHKTLSEHYKPFSVV